MACTAAVNNHMVLLGLCCPASIWPSMSKAFDEGQFEVWLKFPLIEVAETGWRVKVLGWLMNSKGLEQLHRSVLQREADFFIALRMNVWENKKFVHIVQFAPDLLVIGSSWYSSSMEVFVWVHNCVESVWSNFTKSRRQEKLNSCSQSQRPQPASPQQEYAWKEAE